MEHRIAKFLRLYPNQNTKNAYRTSTYDFLDSIYGPTRATGKVTDKEKLVYEELATRYFEDGRDYFEDVLTFITLQHDKPPISARAKIAGVKEFLGYYDVEFTHKELKDFRKKTPRGRRPRTVEDDLTADILRTIILHTDLRGRALLLFLVSSGTRVGEVIKIKLNDVDLTKTPPEVVVREAKGGDTRRVFMSTEAKEVLTEWLKVRESYLKAAKDRNRGLRDVVHCKQKDVGDDRLFPFGETTIRAIWANALSKAGLLKTDNSTGRLQLRKHGLRKFFRSQLALSCPVDIVETLMGHEGYLTDAYRRYTIAQMGEYYLKAEHHVTIFSGDERDIRDRLQVYRAKVEEQEEDINLLKQEIEGIKAKTQGIDFSKLKDALTGDEEVRDMIVELLAQKIVSKQSG